LFSKQSPSPTEKETYTPTKPRLNQPLWISG
jgi:hypothetical protein